jgi:hypothetical protein
MFFKRYYIKISSWLLLTVVSFNFDRYQFSNDLFILLFYKRWYGRIPQTTKLSIHNLPFFWTNSTPKLKGSVTGNTDLDNYILSSRVAPDTTDADVHALYTKPAVLKMEESGKSSRGFRKKPSNCQRNNRNLQTSSNNVHITVGMIIEWHVSIPCTPF